MVRTHSSATLRDPIKCVIWDLDDTLWHGTLAESPDVRVKDGIPEVLATLDARGILHSIASKNNYDRAVDKLKQCRLDHYFLDPQISWNPKSAAVAAIQKSLNIGMGALLFIDDQPFEREEVSAAYPAVTCQDAACYRSLPDMPRLKPALVTVDARRRRQRYLDNVQRTRDEDEFQGTPKDFLATLGMKFCIAGAREEDLPRVEELTVRTNQLNSCGVTYGADELRRFISSDSHDLLVCELTDKYGSYGKIGLALIERRAECHHIKLLLMSCRTASRGLGSVLLTYLMNRAKAEGKRVTADFRRNEWNRQMLVTYQFANFRETARDEQGLRWLENDLSVIQQYPDYVEIIAG